MSKFKVGDRVRAVDETAVLVKGREYTVVAPTDIGPAHHVFVNTGFNGVLNYTDDFFELVESVAVAPATATEPTHTVDTTLGIDLNPAPPPHVGDAVLIPGVIRAINQSPRDTNYNIVFETQNRRMSLHFLEEDFILDECGDDGGCTCANNDNGPDPADTAKAFDALGDWLRAVAIDPSAAFRSNKEAA